jgi:hypothetical protein
LARIIRPRLREWEARHQRAMQENDRLRARIGLLLTDLARRDESG